MALVNAEAIGMIICWPCVTGVFWHCHAAVLPIPFLRIYFFLQSRHQGLLQDIAVL